jgi:glycerate dehydrogenase
MTEQTVQGAPDHKPMKGVFLDVETLDCGDLDRGLLQASLPQWQWYEFSERADIAGRIVDAGVVVTNKCELDRAALQQATHLNLIAVAATGTNNVDLAAAAELGITVCNIRDYASDAVAQHTITLMLNLLSSLPWYWQSVRNGDWSRSRQFCLTNRPIRQARGLNFGVIGYGVLGQATARLAAALRMNVLIAERKGDAVRPGRVAFAEVIQNADVVSIHCPLSAHTECLIDTAVLNAMKPDAILINTARGGIVVERDLADALRRGVIAGAAMDTLSVEPPQPNHVLLAPDIPNLIVTPHNAWASRTARQAAMDQAAKVITAFVAGTAINRVV